MGINATAETAGRATGRRRAFHAGWVTAVLVAAGILGAVILLIHFITDIDVNLLLSDPAEKAFLPAYTGSYTYIGVLALFCALAICLFAASLVADDRDAAIRKPFLVSLGVLAAWLGVDDLWMIHEWAGLAFAQLLGQDGDAGARSRLEGIVFVAYGAAWLGWIAAFGRTVLKTAYILLLLALGSLAASVAIDVGIFLFPELIPNTAWMPTTLSVAEEMLKLTGIFFLLAYAVDSSQKALRESSFRRESAVYGR